MPDRNEEHSTHPPASTSPRLGGAPHEAADVKPLLEKARADAFQKEPRPGTMKTGADTAGGGGTKTIEPGDPPPARTE